MPKANPNNLKVVKSPIYKVNLLIQKGEQLKLPARLIKWTLASGRFIVVFVEIIVISAFVFRYKLDTDLADLQDKINETVPYLESLKNDEQELRTTQFQLASIKSIRHNGKSFPEILKEVAHLTPQTIKLTNINLDRSANSSKTSLTITGQTPSNLELSAFIKALKKDSVFKDINLTNISFDNQTTFTITGNVTESKN